MFLKSNVGVFDRFVRIVFAVVCAYLGWRVNKGFYLFAVILLLTAVFGFCGLYKLFGIDTNRGG